MFGCAKEYACTLLNLLLQASRRNALALISLHPPIYLLSFLDANASNNPKDNWSPALQIRTILLSIQALLGAPNPDDPLANDVAQAWKEDEPAAIATAREWTKQYAKP